MATQVESIGVTQTLKDATWELHQSAEGHKYQQAMVGGSLPLQSYVEFLSQMWVVHRTLEGHLRRLRGDHPFRDVIREHHFREPLLRADLTFFDRNMHDIEALPATDALVTSINEAVEARPLSALGFHYVLEGSTNGSKYLARSIQSAYGLTTGEGTSYLNPHGNRLRERWMGFKADMGQLELSPDDVDTLVRAARSTFSALIGLSEDLSASTVAG